MSIRGRWAPALAVCVALVVLVYSRLHYAPKYLFFFDNANFAFALRHFDPRMHQPQPPGYPVFVALLHAIDIFTRDPHRALLVAGLLGSAFALILLWLWTRRMFGVTPAYIAAGLLLLHPVFWLAGVGNPVRVFLAVVTTATGLAAWGAITAGSPARWFYLMAAVLGFTAGFRPESLPLLLPLWLVVGVYRKLRLHAFLLGGCILLSAAAVWLIPMAVRMGGFATMFHTFADYLRDNSVGHTVVFGAGSERGFFTARKAIIWTLGMSVVWVWALPFAWKRFRMTWDRPRLVVIFAALLPPLFFHSVVHVRDVDQTLISIPIACAIGGAVLASIPWRAGMLAAVVLALAASYWSFRRPFYLEMGAASKGNIHYIDNWTRSTYEAVNQLSHEPGTVLVWHDTVVPWRNVSYYYPDVPLLVMDRSRPFWVHGGASEVAVTEPDGAVVLPVDVKHMILGLSQADANTAEHEWPNARRVGPLIGVKAIGGHRLAAGAVRLSVKR